MDYLEDELMHGVMKNTVGYAVGENNWTIPESLKNNARLLFAKASDVNDAIKNAELSGTKKKKSICS